MPIVQFDDGTKVEFDKSPTQSQIEDAYRQLKASGQLKSQQNPQVNQPTQSTQPSKSFLEKTGDFLGVTPLAKYEAAQIARLSGILPGQLGEGGRQFNQMFNQDRQGAGVPSDTQVLGSAISTGINLASAGGPEKAFGEATKGVGILKGLKSGIKTGALAGGIYGAGQGFASGIGEGKRGGELLGSGLTGGVVGAVGGGVLGGVTGAISGGIKSGFSGPKQILNAGKNIKNVETELQQQPFKKLNIQSSIRDVRVASKADLGTMTQVFKNTNMELGRTLAEESQLQSSTVKNNLRSLFREVSKTYGQELDKAENQLIERGIKISPKEYYGSVIEKTIKEAEERGIPEDLSSIKTLTDWGKKINETKGKSLTLDVLKNIKNSVYNGISSGVRTGNQYGGAEDQFANLFLRNHGEYMSNLSPELSQLNKEFSPMANARNWASKTFRPYNNAEIQRGANLLSKIAKGEVPDKTALNYLKTLSDGSGRFKGAGDLQGKTTEIGASIRDLKKNFDLARYNLISATDLKVDTLQKEMAGLQGRGIELSQQLDKLKDLKRVRDIIIATTLTSVAAPPLIKKFIAH